MSVENLKRNFGIIEVFSKGINWLTIPILAILTTPEIYSQVILNYTYITIITTVVSFGQGRVILKYCSKNLKWPFYVVNIFTIKITILLIIYCLYNNYNYFLIVAGYLMCVHNFACLRYRSIEDVNNFLSLRVSYPILRSVFVLFSILYFEKLEYYVFAECMAAFIPLIFTFLKEDFNSKVLNVNFNQLETSVKLSFPIFIQSIILLISGQMDKLMVGKFLGMEFLASYGVIISLSTSTVFLFSYYSMLYEKDIYRSDKLESVILSDKFKNKSIFGVFL